MTHRPYLTHRVTLIGRDHSNPVHMTDMQRERADAPLQDVGNPIVLRAPMPAWCAGILGGAAVCLPTLYHLGAFS